MSIGRTTLTHDPVALVGPLSMSNGVVRGIPPITNVSNSARLPDGRLKLVGSPLNVQRRDGARARVLAILPDCVE